MDRPKSCKMSIILRKIVFSMRYTNEYEMWNITFCQINCQKMCMKYNEQDELTWLIYGCGAMLTTFDFFAVWCAIKRIKNGKYDLGLKKMLKNHLIHTVCIVNFFTSSTSSLCSLCFFVDGIINTLLMWHTYTSGNVYLWTPSQWYHKQTEQSIHWTEAKKANKLRATGINTK